MINSSRLGAYLGVLSEHKEPSPVFLSHVFPIITANPLKEERQTQERLIGSQ